MADRRGDLISPASSSRYFLRNAGRHWMNSISRSETGGGPPSRQEEELNVPDMSAASFVGVDWGTSSFRLWVMSADGAPLAESRSDEGMLHCSTAGFQPVLDRHLAEVGAPEGLPVLICGMAGARQAGSRRHMSIRQPRLLPCMTRQQAFPATGVTFVSCRASRRSMPMRQTLCAVRKRSLSAQSPMMVSPAWSACPARIASGCPLKTGG